MTREVNQVDLCLTHGGSEFYALPSSTLHTRDILAYPPSYSFKD